MEAVEAEETIEGIENQGQCEEEGEGGKGGVRVHPRLFIRPGKRSGAGAMYGRLRVGILYRSAGRLASVRWPEKVGANGEWPEWPGGATGHEEDVRAWLEQHTGVASRDWDTDTSYVGLFYRALQEGSEFYVLWEPGVGWRGGGTTWDTEVKGKLLMWSDVMVIMESWYDSLKSTVGGGGSHVTGGPGFEAP